MNKVKVLQINSVNSGSTGNIMLNISNEAGSQGFISYIAYADSRSNRRKPVEQGKFIGTILERNMHLKLAYFTGLNGCFSKNGTKRFLKKIDQIKPDIIHLHNLHNCYINLRILFDYIKENNIPVVWTLHDCWAFTGQCPHFTMVKCDKWKTGCYECPQFKEYPASRIDRTKKMYSLKKQWFTGVNNLIIVTPSQWLGNLVSKSYLKDYSVKVINNGIDLNTFEPTANVFREKYELQNKFIILGVASPWSEKKGLDTFVELSKRLDEGYKVVLVGLADEQIKKLPQNILGISRTNNAKELAEIYTTADIFVNPTLEDNFPTTNLEAIACGTPVITFNTGGSIEVINKYTGIVVKNNEIDELMTQIYLVLNEGKEKYMKERLIEANKYNRNNKFKEYIKLYEEII